MSIVNLDDMTTDQVIRSIFHSVKNIEATLADQQKKVVVLENNVVTLNKQVYDLQNIVNLREQELRGLSIRISGLPFLEDEKSSTDVRLLPKRVYEKILSPLLLHAKNMNFIDKIPSLNNTIISCYRVGGTRATTNTGSPPPIVMKLNNEAVRLAILKSKRTAMPTPSSAEKDMGINRFIISEDLTPNCYKKVKELQRDERTDKVWTVDGKIRFSLKDDKSVYRVYSIFDPVDVIIHKVQK